MIDNTGPTSQGDYYTEGNAHGEFFPPFFSI